MILLFIYFINTYFYSYTLLNINFKKGKTLERKNKIDRKNKTNLSPSQSIPVYTVFHPINAAATILFTEHNLRLQFEGGH